MIPNQYGTKWTDDEIILAYYYYCQIPFGKLHQLNPEIIRIASKLGRTPSSVALKMANLAHFDPALTKRGVTGMSNASKADARIVAEFYGNWEELILRAEQFEISFSGKDEILPSETAPFPSGVDVCRNRKERVNQNFFRTAVLTSYQNKCCITGVQVTDLLIASHIKPWAVSDPKTERVNPKNGLCLNALHDKAFDKGLITVLPDFTVRISSKLNRTIHGDELNWLLQCDRKAIHMPEKFTPDKLFLEYHNDVIFQA